MLAADLPSTAESYPDRTITLRAALPKPLIAGSQLLHFAGVATLGTDSCTPLTIDTCYFPDAPIAVTRTDGAFCLSGVCIADGHVRLIDPEQRLTLSAPRPDPARDAISLDFQLAEPGESEIYIEDILGRRVMTVAAGWMRPGNYSRSISIASLATGTYRIVLVTPSDRRAQRLQVVR